MENPELQTTEYLEEKLANALRVAYENKIASVNNPNELFYSGYHCGMQEAFRIVSEHANFVRDLGSFLLYHSQE